MFKHSLALRIFLINFIFLIIPTFVWLGFFFEKSRTENRIGTLYHMRDLAYSRASRIEEHIGFCEDMLTILINRFNLSDTKELDHSTLIQEFQQALNAAPSFDNIIFTERTAQDTFVVKAATNYEENADVTQRLFITSALASGQSTTLAIGSKGNPWVFITKVIKNSANVITGTLSFAYDPESLLKKVMDAEYNILGTHFALMSVDGILFAGDSPELFMSTFFPLKSEQIAKLKEEGVVGSLVIPYHPVQTVDIPPFKDVLQRDTSEGHEMGITWPIPGSNALLLVIINEDTLLTPFYQHVWKSIFVVALASFLSSLIIWLLVKRLSRPLSQFLTVMQEVSSGNLDIRFNEDKAGYEINALGEAVNRMLKNLLIQIETIRKEPLKQKIAAKEMKIGHQIQQRILPQRLPVVEHFAMAAVANPSLEVGGDFYDVFLQKETDTSKVFVTVADGAGKGVSACLYSLCLRSMLRSYAASSDDVGLAIQDANNLFCQDTSDSSMFVTLFMGILDPVTLKFDYFSAGHPPALLRRTDGSVEKLATLGTPLGIGPFPTLQQKSVQLNDGDILLLYSDGITEAMNPEGQLYSEERLISFLKKTTPKTPQITLDSLIEDIEEFENGAKQHDDITAILIYVSK